MAGRDSWLEKQARELIVNSDAMYMRCCERMPWQVRPHRTCAAPEQRCPKMFVVTEVVFHVLERPRLTRYK